MNVKVASHAVKEMDLSCDHKGKHGLGFLFFFWMSVTCMCYVCMFLIVFACLAVFYFLIKINMKPHS